MAYLQFNKFELGNLEYSLKREFLATNRAGGYANTTLVCCNTRKYHGLLVVPVEAFGGENHVLLSTLDESLIQHEKVFNLGIHRYPGIYEPRGHKYITDFQVGKILTLTYRVGGIVLRKELMLMHDKDQVLIRYTLLEAHSATTLRLKPYLAFRNVHQLTKANVWANIFHGKVEKGISSRLYDNFPTLYMQLNVQNEFVPCPDWYKNISYLQEQQRGYEYQEDLFVPGYFECPLKKGQSVIFSASVKEEKPNRFKALFEKDLDLRPDRGSYQECLRLAADQFIVRRGGKTEVMAGYPWFGRWGRDTFIALPGLTLAGNYDPVACKEVLDTMVGDMRGGLFPNMGNNFSSSFNSVDAPLWFFWTLQKYVEAVGHPQKLWNDYGPVMKNILRTYKNGSAEGIAMHANGLIWARIPGKALTWMDAVTAQGPVTQRGGYAVEINALWYNALRFALDLAAKRGRSEDDKAFVAEFQVLPALVEKNYAPTFWLEAQGYLADYVDENGPNRDTRPNQVLACSLPFSPISDEMKARVLKVCTRELVTPRGLRTLTPKNPQFVGLYEGSQAQRDGAYHQGTVWPWLLGPYIEAMLKIHGPGFIPRAKELAAAFEEDITLHGVGSIAEVYDGNPPHNPHGSTSQAWSVAAVLRALKLIEACEEAYKEA